MTTTTLVSRHYELHEQSNTLEDLFSQVLASGIITNNDRYNLKTILLEESISHDHQIIINRILYGVRRGFLKLAN